MGKQWFEDHRQLAKRQEGQEDLQTTTFYVFRDLTKNKFTITASIYEVEAGNMREKRVIVEDCTIEKFAFGETLGFRTENDNIMFKDYSYVI